MSFLSKIKERIGGSQTNAEVAKKYASFYSVVRGVLSTQSSMMGNLKGDALERYCDPTSVGYINGFYDCVAQRYSIEHGNDYFNIGLILFKNLYGDKPGEQLFMHQSELFDNPAYKRGLDIGALDFNKWLRQKSDPVGWLAYVRGN